jgi:hypothetical protein
MLVNHSTELYGDIFRLREKMMNDIKLKKRLDKITTRKSPYHTESHLSIFEKNNSQKSDQNKSPDKELKLPIIKNNVEKRNQASHKSLNAVMIESKKIISRIKEEKIQVDNEKFLGKLLSIRSPLRADVMNESFRKSRDYMSLACKVRDHNDMTRKVLKSFKISEVQEDIKKLLNI